MAKLYGIGRDHVLWDLSGDPTPESVMAMAEAFERAMRARGLGRSFTDRRRSENIERLLERIANNTAPAGPQATGTAMAKRIQQIIDKCDEGKITSDEAMASLGITPPALPEELLFEGTIERIAQDYARPGRHVTISIDALLEKVKLNEPVHVYRKA